LKDALKGQTLNLPGFGKGIMGQIKFHTLLEEKTRHDPHFNSSLGYMPY